MSRQFWMLWLVPLACWAVYLCWLTGYQNGYQAGHDDGWNTARKAIGDGDIQLAEVHHRN